MIVCVRDHRRCVEDIAHIRLPLRSREGEIWIFERATLHSRYQFRYMTWHELTIRAGAYSLSSVRNDSSIRSR